MPAAVFIWQGSDDHGVGAKRPRGDRGADVVGFVHDIRESFDLAESRVEFVMHCPPRRLGHHQMRFDVGLLLHHLQEADAVRHAAGRVSGRLGTSPTGWLPK